MFRYDSYFPEVTNIEETYRLKIFTGQKFLDYLVGMVHSRDWKMGWKFCFYKDEPEDELEEHDVKGGSCSSVEKFLSGSSEEDETEENSESEVSDSSEDFSDDCLFSIVVNGTYNQPGNGYLQFPQVNNDKLDWNSLSMWLKNENFPAKRRYFLKNKLDKIDFNDYFTAVNVLLCFEIARRVPVDSELYPITQHETETAIDIVMEASEKNYQQQVDRLLTMFRSGRRESDYYGRRLAFDAIMRFQNQEVGKSASASRADLPFQNDPVQISDDELLNEIEEEKTNNEEDNVIIISDDEEDHEEQYLQNLRLKDSPRKLRIS